MKVNYQIILDKTLQSIIESNKRPKLLLHSCCAPCSSYVLNYLSKYFDITIYYYNPNIDSYEEFIKRSQEQIRLINEMPLEGKVDYVIENYDNNEFDRITKRHKDKPEGSVRCFACYGLRLARTAKYAKEHGYDYFTTTLSISPYKNSQKLNEIGLRLEKQYEVKYLESDFKKKNGYKQSIELSHKYGLYRQDYCGCIYSKQEHIQKLKEKQTINENNEEDVLKEEVVFKNQKIKSNKKLLISCFLTLLILIIPGYLIFTRYNDDTVYINIEDEISEINELYIYGNHFNIKGKILLDEPVDNVQLSFKNKKNYFDIDLNYTYSDGILEFRLADYLNTGFILDDIKLGNYEVFLKTTKEETEKYYILDNKTEYKNTVYYTLSKDDKYNKITITNAERYNTLGFNVSVTNDEAYDIVLDPGHGGNDSGACLRDICETRYTLNFANTLKKQLESAGFRVKLTRDTDTTLKTYGTNSRTGIPYEAHAKYLISLHMNAGANYSGFELYTSNHIDYTLANRIATNLSNINEFQSSPSTFNRVTPNGIFTRTMGDKELEEFVTDAIENNYEKYSVSKETNYYYMIRETGGYMSGAYVDGREGNRNNPYVKSNVGSESYILELGYITSEHDLNLINNHNTEYLQAVSDAISSYLLHK